MNCASTRSRVLAHDRWNRSADARHADSFHAALVVRREELRPRPGSRLRASLRDLAPSARPSRRSGRASSVLPIVRRRRRRCRHRPPPVFWPPPQATSGEQRARDAIELCMVSSWLVLLSPASSAGSTAMTGATWSESPRSSEAVGNSSGLIWPSSRSHSFDQSLNQPSSVDFERHTPYASSDFCLERLGDRRSARRSTRRPCPVRGRNLDHPVARTSFGISAVNSCIREVLRDLADARGRGDRVRRVLDREHARRTSSVGSRRPWSCRSSHSLNRFCDLRRDRLVLRQTVAEVQVRRELDVEVLLELVVGLGELARGRSSSERRPRRRRPCRLPSRTPSRRGRERRERLAQLAIVALDDGQLDLRLRAALHRLRRRPPCLLLLGACFVAIARSRVIFTHEPSICFTGHDCSPQDLADLGVRDDDAVGAALARRTGGCTRGGA